MMNRRTRNSNFKMNRPANLRGAERARVKSPVRPVPRIVPVNRASITPPNVIHDMLERFGERSDDLQRMLTEYLALLLEANQIHNLTGDDTPEKQWLGHIGDALSVAELWESRVGKPVAGSRILDVGSGGGVPGLILGMLWPKTRVDLLEATEKKAEFLKRVVKSLGLANVGGIVDRAETVGHDPQYRESYDWVTARALAPLPVLAEWTIPFLKVGGRLLAIKGSELDEELKESKRAFKLLGAIAPPEIISYVRPDEKKCKLVVYHKTTLSPSPYPRRVGIASTHPL